MPMMSASVLDPGHPCPLAELIWLVAMCPLYCLLSCPSTLTFLRQSCWLHFSSLLSNAWLVSCVLLALVFPYSFGGQSVTETAATPSLVRGQSPSAQSIMAIEEMQDRLRALGLTPSSQSSGPAPPPNLSGSAVMSDSRVSAAYGVSLLGLFFLLGPRRGCMYAVVNGVVRDCGANLVGRRWGRSRTEVVLLS